MNPPCCDFDWLNQSFLVRSHICICLMPYSPCSLLRHEQCLLFCLPVFMQTKNTITFDDNFVCRTMTLRVYPLLQSFTANLKVTGSISLKSKLRFPPCVSCPVLHLENTQNHKGRKQRTQVKGQRRQHKEEPRKSTTRLEDANKTWNSDDFALKPALPCKVKFCNKVNVLYIAKDNNDRKHRAWRRKRSVNHPFVYESTV